MINRTGSQISAEKVKVLVIDDEEAIRRNFEIFLEDLGYEVVTAENGDLAVELIQKEIFDIVLTDLRMAQMGGMKVISQMQKLRPDTPVVVVSGSGGVEDVIRAIRLGAWDYVTKPIHDPEELDGAIRRALERARLLEEGRRRQERLEEQVRRSEERFRETFEQAAVGIAHVSLDGKLILINQRFSDIVGYSTEELLTMTFQDITYPPDLAPDLEKLKALLDGKVRTYSMEKRYIRKDASLVWVYLTTALVRESSGAPAYLIGVVEDITPRKRAEEELKRSEEKFSRLFMTSPAILVIWNLGQSRLVDVNEAFERATAFKREEVIGRDPAELGLWEDPKDQGKISELLRAQGRLQNSEQRLRNKAGITVECLLSAELIELEGEPCALLAASDITELRKLENQILRMQREESIGRLVNGVAHDINNILSPILTATDLLGSSEESSRNQRYINIIQSSALRAADLVKQLSLYSRGVESARADVDPAAVVKGITRIIRETFPRSIDIRCLMPHHLRRICGDETQIHQVVMNLCVNARDAMPNGGILEIEAMDIVLDAQFVEKNREASAGPYVLIKVSDTGSGISQDIVGKIFDPFFTTKPVGQGTGLGLSTVIGIVKSHGGFVDVQSSVGIGSQFLVYLPAKESPCTAETVERLLNEPEGRGELILVVDDEEVLRDLMKEVLESSGYKVVCARDGAESLKLYALRSQEIRLVIMDMWMPLMDGAEALRQMQALNPQVQAIAVSGVPLSKDKNSTVNPTAIKAFLQKPVKMHELLETLHNILGGQQADQ